MILLDARESQWLLGKLHRRQPDHECATRSSSYYMRSPGRATTSAGQSANWRVGAIPGWTLATIARRPWSRSTGRATIPGWPRSLPIDRRQFDHPHVLARAAFGFRLRLSTARGHDRHPTGPRRAIRDCYEIEP